MSLILIFVKGINAWAVWVVRYSAGILDWTTQVLKSLDVKTRKTLNVWSIPYKEQCLALVLETSWWGKGTD